MEIALGMAHKLDDSNNGQNSVPSKDRLIEAVIFQFKDVVMITSCNVDLEYACKGKETSKSHFTLS